MCMLGIHSCYLLSIFICFCFQESVDVSVAVGEVKSLIDGNIYAIGIIGKHYYKSTNMTCNPLSFTVLLIK